MKSAPVMCPKCGAVLKRERVDRGGAEPSVLRWVCPACPWVEGDDLPAPRP